MAVIHDGVFAVLNDTAWLNVIDPEESARTPITDVVHVGYGQTYYGGRASWGLAEFGPDGRIHAKSLVPENSPSWIRTTTFEAMIVTADGVYFTSRNGVVFRDFASKQCHFFELDKVSKIFAVGNKVFVSSFENQLRYIDIAGYSIQTGPRTLLDRAVVEQAARLDDEHTLVSTVNGRIFVFDGQSVTPWPHRRNVDLSGPISVMQRLADGNVAIAVKGKGVFILSPDGEVLTSLTTAPYHQVFSIASREPGVLWLLTEDTVEKVLYSGGLTAFGQRLGLTLGWPTVASCNGRIIVASDGVLYEALSTAPGAAARFERIPTQPPGGAWALSSSGNRLLTGSGAGIFSMEADGTMKRIGHVRDLTHLAMIGENLCYAIGSAEIALFEWDGMQWREPTPRVPGLPHSFSTQRTAKSVWVEMGGDGVARISRKNGALQVTTIRNESWTKALWVNIGIVGDIAVLSTLRDQRRFFDEAREDWCLMPEFSELLDRSPNWIARVWMDETGTLWATHTEGVVRFTPKGTGYDMDLSTYDFINDRYPMVQVLPGNDIWISASRSLHHVEAIAKRTDGPPVRRPVLVSIMDARRNVELLAKRPLEPASLLLPYSQNSLLFQFFSGGYAWRRAPVYEFRLGADEPWAPVGTGSSLRFPALEERKYNLQVRVAGAPRESEELMNFAFEILPPWHRTLPAYVFYILLGVGGLISATKWSSHLARRRNQALELVVKDRTRELEFTMAQLNEEARTNATLAERDRLAGEIHDSVQQGLSGAMIQLDTTLKLPSLSGDLRERLQVARSMVSYARQEVQHAVWDMHSSLLEQEDLAHALRKLAGFTMPGTLAHTVSVVGVQVPLPQSTQHHLLRIAQEATTNAVRHAMARTIAIELDYKAEAVSLRISDDGIGFDSRAVLDRFGHFGLRGIHGRAKKLGGELLVKSALGKGTSIEVKVPLPSLS
ncbi:MAG: sensor histidine kinase [Opitutaceae bacterium]